jgi:SAM-dependent methyltransferase
MTSITNLLEEARAFDDRIVERLANGHIPDLRRVEPCDWFYNNVWRRPYLVDMVCGRMFRFALKHLQGGCKRILEVGSGPGYISLELARHGFEVTGLELSPGCVAVAEKMSAENPYREGFGSLRYLNADFLAWNSAGSVFDGICFFQTLHHFSEIGKVIEKATQLLRPGGVLIVNEPSRDLLNLQAIGSKWHETLEIPQTEPALKQYVQDCLTEFQEAHDCSEPVQSVNDNSMYSSSILNVLEKGFTQLDLEPDYAFLPRMGGGLRNESEERLEQITRFLEILDKFLIQTGVVHPGGFFWSGMKQ